MKKIGFISILMLFSLGFFGQELKLGLPLGHSDAVLSAVFSPDGKSALTASWDYTAGIWDVSSGKLVHTLEGHTDWILFAVFSPGGQTVLTASLDITARLWDASSGELIHTLAGHIANVRYAVFSPNGKKIVTASGDHSACLWDASSGELLHTFEGHANAVLSAVFSPNGKKILTASEDNTACLWDASSGELLYTFEGHTEYILSAKFSPNGEKIVTASGDYTACLWDAFSGDLLHTFYGHTSEIISTVFSPDGQSVLTASFDNTSRIWDVSSGKLLYILEGHSSMVNSAVFSPDGKSVLTASWDYTACIWDASSGKLVHTLEGHTRFVNSAVFSPDGNSFVTVSDDSLVHLWHSSSGKLIYSLEGHADFVGSVVFSPDGKSILTASQDNTARLWESSSGKLLHTFEGLPLFYYSAIFSPDGKSILTASEDKIAHLWDASSGRLLLTLEGRPSRYYSADFSPDGKRIVTTSSDNTVCIWDTSSGKLLNTLEGHTENILSVVFSPDGKSVLTASQDETSRLWDASSGRLLHTLKGHSYPVKFAIFSPNGKTILTVSYDSTPRLWDTSSGKLLNTLEGQQYQINSAVFSPDGEVIVTASGDKTVLIWDASSGKLLQNLVGHTNRVTSAIFSPDEKSILTSSWDGSVRLWDFKTRKQLILHFTFDGDPNKWVHLHPSGLFDASPDAMELMYWTKGLEVIDFDQLKYYYHEPGLWGKMIKDENLREVPNIKELKLHPEVTIGEVKDGLVPVTFTKRDGGFGDITVSINGVQIATETKGSKVDTTLETQTVYYSVKDNPRLVNGANTITVNAASRGNIIQGRGASVVAFFDEKKHIPQFYGVIIGINEYSNPAINLSFPVKDAVAISKSMEMGANNLFTKGTHMYTITSESDIKPTKESILNVFEEISSKAKAEDVILVHLSGHGVTVGDGLNNEFYFLTSDATSSSKEAFALKFNRENQTISTAEWVTLLQSVNANKRIMIIDACGSGQAVDNLIAQRDVEGSQIKAIDRMKDRTGMFIISGCTADAVSYEASQYGQGLLTYSILQAMKGAALKENKYVDVETVFNYARETVPVLAEGIGGVQKPQLLKPKGGSFDIGIMNEEDKEAVPLSEPKRVFIRSTLVDKTKFRDVLNISKLLNEELSLLSARGEEVSIVFFDTDEYGNSCQITGGYWGTSDDIKLDLTVICETQETQHSLSATSVKELVRKIIDLVSE